MPQATTVVIPKRNKPVEEIYRAVALVTAIEESVFRSKLRTREVAEARHMSIYFIMKYNPDFTLVHTGRLFGIDHSTVIWSRSNVENLFKSDRDYREKYLAIEALLTGKADHDA